MVAGRYRLTERLGGGGMGVVWKAEDERLRRTVAVKEVILPPGLDDARLEEIRRRTMREGRIAAKLHHPQLITVYDVIEDDGRPYLIIEYLPSTSLSRVLDERGTLPPEEVAGLGAQAAAALAAAHEAGVVHRDVKPANVLVGDNGTIKITDFGVSRVVEDVTGTTTGTFVGTPAYLAPEVAQGKAASFESDVYALGATLYKAVEGAPPVGKSENPMALLHRIASGVVVPPTKAGPLTDVLLRLLDADPARRPTMAQARVALAAVADGAEPTVPGSDAAPATTPATAPATATVGATAVAPAEPAPTPPRPPIPARSALAGDDGRKRRRAGLLLALVCVLVAASTALVLVLTRGTNAPDDDRTAAGPDTGSSVPATEEETGDPAPSTTTSAPPSSSEPADTTTPSASTPAPPPPATPPADPAQAVTDYYALMPGDLDAGFARLTPRFQQSPAGGRAGYANFWGQMSAVSAAQATASGQSVEVTIVYSYKDGRRVQERHRYGLVNQDGRWLIDTVVVLSTTDIA